MAFEQRGPVPVQVGDELEVKIEAVGEKGDGVAKKDGFVLFVPNTKAGEVVMIRVTKVLRKLGFAEVIGQGSKEKSGYSSDSEDVSDDEEVSEDSEVIEGEEDASSEDSENFGEEDEQR